jgi:hypothetical protein
MLMSDIEKQARIDHVLRELEKKRSLTDICKRDKAAPSMAAFLAWVAKDATLADRYACAREVQITALLEETLDIADSASDDIEVYIDKVRNKPVAKINGPCVRRAQLQIEARERFAKMMLPERFAMNRTDITSGGKALPAPVQQNDNRIQALLVLAAERAAALGQPKAIDVTPLSIDDVMK